MRVFAQGHHRRLLVGPLRQRTSPPPASVRVHSARGVWMHLALRHTPAGVVRAQAPAPAPAEVRRGPSVTRKMDADRTAVMLLPARATKTVYFVRHGEVSSRRRCTRLWRIVFPPLTPRAGLAQRGGRCRQQQLQAGEVLRRAPDGAGLAAGTKRQRRVRRTARPQIPLRRLLLTAPHAGGGAQDAHRGAAQAADTHARAGGCVAPDACR